MILRPYQEAGADFLFEHDRAMMLAPVGAGKTATALTAMRDAIQQGVAKRFLVLAPLRVCTHVWPAEARRWAPQLTVALGVGNVAERFAALLCKTDVYVTNYDNLQWLAAQDERLLDFDAVVFDELTRLKNPSGKRFKALTKILKDVHIRWGLTGSFTSNGLEDCFGQCKIVDQLLLGRSKGAFLQQYFYCVNRDYGEWEPLPGALERVMARIKPATYLLEPGQYSDTLPPLHTVEMRCEMPYRKPYEDMKKTMVLEMPDRAIIAANAAAVTGKLQQLASGWVYDTTPEGRTAVWLGTWKFDLLDDVLNENQHANTIIVYNFIEEFNELKRRYPDARSPTLDDITAIDDWNAGKVSKLLIHPKSAGHGLNLQHGGHHIVFLSLPWSLELYEQTIGRLHRSGQQHDVWCYVLLTEDTVDDRIWGALQDKRSISDVAIEELRG